MQFEVLGVCLTVIGIVSGILYWVIQSSSNANEKKTEGVAATMEEKRKLTDQKLEDCQEMRKDCQENINRRIGNIETDVRDLKEIAQKNELSLTRVETILSERFPKIAERVRERENNNRG